MGFADSTTGTSKSTQVDRTVKFIFPDGAEVSSKVTSKTTFSTRNSRRNHGNNQPYDAEATASLIEVVAATMAADAVRQAEQEIRVEW
jgi:hypothetical protein